MNRSINWEQSPVWAKWFTRDRDGVCFWHEGKPYPDKLSGKWISKKRLMEIEERKIKYLFYSKTFSQSLWEEEYGDDWTYYIRPKPWGLDEKE